MVNYMKDITQMQEDAEKRNTEVLAMIEAVSDTTSSDRSSFVRKFYSTRESNNECCTDQWALFELSQQVSFQ
jgi:hypothetical protein